ncbi:hypothetical protein GUITHDRAFT_63496, partial [Guillardia theta CCMP2712]
MVDSTVGDVVEGHGTHVCGIVSGNANGQADSQFLAAESGVAPDAKVVFQDAGDSSASGYLNIPADLELGVYSLARGGGAHVHSNSWGGLNNEYSIDTYHTDDFAYLHPDYLIIFAAGNDGPSYASVSEPAVAKNIISVGASAGIPENGWTSPQVELPAITDLATNVASFSSLGPTYDGRFKPDLLAPGQQVVSARSEG